PTRHHGLVAATPAAPASFSTSRRLIAFMRPSYPFTAPSVRPLTTQRWKIRYMMRGGSVLRNDAPIIGPQKNTSSTTKSESPVVMVRTSTLLTKTFAYRNSFHDWVNEKNVTTARAGRDIGRITRTRLPSRPQPSTSAAS